MDLKTKTKTVHYVNYSDLDAFISHHTGREFSFASDEEMSNDTDKVMKIDGKPSDFDLRDVADFRAGKRGPEFMTRRVLDVLCAEGKLPAGEYVIRVSW